MTSARSDDRQANPFPAWVRQLKDRYLAGGGHFFILHGNVDDVVATGDGPDLVLDTVPDYLARHLVGSYDLVLQYDLGRGPRLNAGGDPARLTRMNTLLLRLLDGPLPAPREPGPAMAALDKLVTMLLVRRSEEQPLKAAFLFDYGELICPPGEHRQETLAFFLNWARSPIIRRVNILFILLTSELARLHPTLVQSGYTTEIHLPLPTKEERRGFVVRAFPGLTDQAERLSGLSAGLTISNLDQLLRLTTSPAQTDDEEKADPIRSPGPDQPETNTMDSVHSEEPGDKQLETRKSKPGTTFEIGLLTKLKKELIEAQCPGLLEFMEPRVNLDMIAGHEAARKRLADDAGLIRRGALDAVPMGYLLCGPVGVGKTFLALCYAGTVGLPCVTLRNFRSKYVGETEANLERILAVLRELGPVAVIIDEADAAVGDRGASGDSGTSARVFAQLASQMGDTRYRGRIIWFMLTCRPDLLPVDLKRQGRCEEHIPLFYPETPEETGQMFLTMARKLRLELTAADLPPVNQILSGADIEAVLTRAHRQSLIENRPLDRNLLNEVLTRFRSPRGPEHELQWLAAIVECSDLAYLPPSVRAVAETPEGYESLRQRFRKLGRELD